MEDAFQGLLIEQIPRLRRYARALTGDSTQADDLVQDCLERACRKSRLWRTGSDIRAWLFTMLHNLHVSRIRKEARRGTEVPLGSGAEGYHRDGTDAHLGWHDVQKGLARLPLDQRAVLLLVAVEGMRYEEVALVLDVPLGTVMSRLFRARERLRRWVDGESAPRLRSIK